MLGKAWIRENIRQGRYQISEHVIRFLMAGLLTVPEIEAAAMDGRVIDMSPPGRRAASLLLKATVGGKVILVRVSRGPADGMIIPLAYLAAEPPWDALSGNFPNEGDTMQTVFQRCFFCGGQVKAITIGNFDYRLEGKLYVIKDTPAGLCLQCGEKYVTADTARTINRLIEAGRFTHTEEVHVLAFTPTA